MNLLPLEIQIEDTWHTLTSLPESAAVAIYLAESGNRFKLFNYPRPGARRVGESDWGRDARLAEFRGEVFATLNRMRPG
jgi:hypothetical protein